MSSTFHAEFTGPNPDHLQAAPVEPVYPTGQPVEPPPTRRRRDEGMRSILTAPATYALVAINIAVFLWMWHAGVSPRTPTPDDLIRFGANNSELVLNGEWWRIITAMFVHVGLIHLATNMWCLWNLGLLGEPLLGPFGIFAVYVLSGAAGNLLSMAWNVIRRTEGQVGAGASGAVFGLAGILIVLLSNKRLSEARSGFPGIPWFELRALRKSVIQFAALNLVIGLGTIFVDVIRIDNMAHLGGFLSGLAMGVPLVPRMTSGRSNYLQRQRLAFGFSAFALALFGYFISYLR